MILEVDLPQTEEGLLLEVVLVGVTVIGVMEAVEEGEVVGVIEENEIFQALQNAI